jgi:hypothetical protein
MPSSLLPQPFDVIHRKIYSDNHCFYCGTPVKPKESRTKEHVFPQWLQDQFDLRHKQLNLPNGTAIQYTKLTVPCCVACNTVHLSKLEKRVKRYLFKEPISVAREHADDVFTWICKIFIGIIYRERLLPNDRRRPADGPILPDEFWNAFQMTHFLIQRLRVPIEFDYIGKLRIPGSVFIFDVQLPISKEARFDFRDSFNHLCLYMRAGTRGIIAVIDGGATDFSIGKLLRKDGRYTLHPQQLEELAAKVFYKASLFNRTPKYLISEREGRYRVMQMPLAGLSAKPMYEEWLMERYAWVLSAFTGVPRDVLNPAPHLVRTFIRDAGGRFIKLDMKKTPYRGVH